ncbi:MAG: N-acetyl-gamma-glutamyl-phosphate reductase [Coriobacteriales bacterium]|nr:N-acetyl-gamma-glutamyl-phosphate reductase [Coriobacteriales bacterium]
MTKPRVYIDGQSGTTGLQIFERIGNRDDLELLRIDEDKRHDLDERRRFINAADVVFLCLPDEGAREAVSLVENPHVRVIDASTAHRTAPGWTYGFPELNAGQRQAIASSRRIANPGCHATGFISVVAPLVQAGVVPADYPLTCFSLTGYSGGGKQMIASYEAHQRPRELDAPGVYGLTLAHKHLPEMQVVCGLATAPVFLPVVDDYYKGMATSVMLHNRLLAGVRSAQDVHRCLAAHYAHERLVSVAPFNPAQPTLYANELAGTNELRIVVCGNDERTTVTALFDNLGKGASGAAVQNMNIVLGLDETRGLV